MSSLARRGWCGAMVLGALLGSACAREQESLIVERVIAYADDECLADPGEMTSLSHGRLDLLFRTPYTAAIHIVNDLVPREAQSSNSNTDPSEMQIQDALVELSLPQAPEIIDRLRAQDPALVGFSVPLQTQSLPGGGELGMNIRVVSQASAVALLPEVQSFPPGTTLTLLVDLVVRARRSGNVRGNIGIIESRSFQFPIDLCVGCMYSCANCVTMPCPDPSTTRALAGFLCGNAQDTVIFPLACEDEM